MLCANYLQNRKWDSGENGDEVCVVSDVGLTCAETCEENILMMTAQLLAERQKHFQNL